MIRRIKEHGLSVRDVILLLIVLAAIALVAGRSQMPLAEPEPIPIEATP